MDKSPVTANTSALVCCSISSFVFSRVSLLRPLIIILAPSRANSRATLFPSPWLEAATKATLFFSPSSIIIFLSKHQFYLTNPAVEEPMYLLVLPHQSSALHAATQTELQLRRPAPGPWFVLYFLQTKSAFYPRSPVSPVRECAYAVAQQIHL